jgi:hypothetical protein
MTNKDPGVLPDRLAHPLLGLLPDSRFVKVITYLSQITQQCPLAQCGEKP